MTEITSETVSIRNANLCIHRWPTESSSSSPRALAVVFHGFLAHGKYPTVRYAADRLAAAGLAVISSDLRGHGRSEGLPGYLEGGPDGLVLDAVAITEHAMSLHPNLKVFLVGSSMGGTIALAVAQELEKKKQMIAGVVLLAPMLKLSVSPMASSFLEALASIIPTWQIIPSSSTSADEQYRDPIKRTECEEDEFAVRGTTIRVASALTCVQLASRLQEKFAEIQIPLLIMVADQDVVVKNEGSLDLMEKAPSSDKTLKRYPALHGLLCEPKPLVDEIEQDMVDWIQARC
jgi:alpha-beta hydrolase superfamily lysophospholipase